MEDAEDDNALFGSDESSSDDEEVGHTRMYANTINVNTSSLFRGHTAWRIYFFTPAGFCPCTLTTIMLFFLQFVRTAWPWLQVGMCALLIMLC